MADYDTEPEGAADTAGLDGLSKKLIGWVRQDMPHVHKWRKEARECFNIYANRQWSKEDEQALKDDDRVPVSFNEVAPMVNAVIGSEINNRREVRYFPREQGDAIANQLLSEAAEWFRDQTAAEDEESSAFKHTVISGMGWTDTRLDFDDNPDGDPRIECINCLEMGWDACAVKDNLTDARRMWRVRHVSYEDAVALTGIKDKSLLNAGWVKDQGDSDARDQDEEDLYLEDDDDELGNLYEEKKFCIVEIRWMEREPFWRGVDLENPQEMREYSEEEAKILEERGLPVVRQQRKVVRRAFIGKEVLGKPDNPMVPPGTGLFGWGCITGYRDEIENQFYGVVRAALDPQRWSNKFFSQVMYLLNSQAKGGVMFEKGAILDIDEFEASWARSDAATEVKSGALEKGLIQPKPVAQFPAGFFTLFQETREAISNVTGLSKEFIGTREVDQAGVLEYQRRQSSLNILAGLFNSLRRYRKQQGRVLLYLIQEHLADNRLVRIVGDGKAQYVPLTKDAVADKKYDIIIDDSPSSPNEKERTWQIIMEMLPLVKDFMDLETAVELLDASPLPATMVAKFKERFQQKQQQQAEQPSPEEQQAQMEMEMRKAEHQFTMAEKSADLQGKQIDLQVKQAEAGMELQGQQAKQDMDARSQAIDMLMKMREAEIQKQIDERKLQVDMANLAIKERANAIAAKRANAAKTNAAKQ